MVTVPYNSFNGGEIAKEFYGRLDQQRFYSSAKVLEDFIVTEAGASMARGGTLFVAEVKDSSKKVLLIPFVFNNVDPYVIEVGDEYMRFYRVRGQIVESDVTITGATQANPVVITASGHGFSNGDQVYIYGVAGMTQLNNRRFDVANVTAGTFELSGIDGSAFTAYSSGGVANKVYEIASPYTEDDLFDSNGAPAIQFAQSKDFLFLAHPDFAPRQLTRSGDTAWTLSAFTPTAGPFKDENQTATTFTFDGLGASNTISGATAAYPVVITATAHTLNDGDTVLIEGVSGMTEINNRRFKVANSTTNTFELENEDGSLHTDYSSGGTAKKINESVGDTGTITASASTFTANDVDTYILMRLTDYSDIPPWQTSHGYYPGVLSNNQGLIYEALNRGEAGAEPPAHLEGDRWDGPATQEAYEETKAITGVTKADPAVVTSNAHGFNNDDIVKIESVGGMTEINDREFYVSDALTNTFQLRGEDSTGHTTYTSGGTAKRLLMSSIQWRFRNPGHAIFKITGYTSATEVDVEIVRDAAGFQGIAMTEWRQSAWSATEGYPRAVELHENRLVWAGTSNEPLVSYFSASLDFFNYSPFDEDGGVTAVTAFNRELNSNNPIRWLKSIDKGLLVGTIGGEWLITTSTLSDELTPTTAQAKRFSEFGTAAIQPVRVGEAALYGEFSRKRVQEIVFNLDVSQMLPRDLTEFSPQIFESPITWMAWASEPFKILWCGRADGSIAGMTYNRSETVKVNGWHNHTIAGTASAAETGVVIPSPDGTIDDLWVSVKRTVNGVTRRYVEILMQPECSATSAGCYTESGLVYDGAPATTISGLWHLVGETVYPNVDGAFHAPVVVGADGTIELDFSGSVVHVGLYETKVLETLSPEYQTEFATTVQGKKKRFKKAVARLFDSRGGWIGSDANNMDRIIYDETTMDTAVDLFTGDIEQTMPGYFADSPVIRIEQRDPGPLNVSALFGMI